MLKILFKQPVNIWRTLGLRYKIEAILLFVLIYAFMATRLNTLFGQWIKDGATETGIILIVSNLFTLLLSFSSVLIIRWFIPKQRAVSIFISQPLNNQQVIKILIYYSAKYLSVYLLFFLPLLTAFYTNFGIFPTLFSVLIVTSINLSFLLILFWLRNLNKSLTTFIFYSLVIIIAYHSLFAIFYWWTEQVILYQLVTLFFFAITFRVLYKNNSKVMLLENFLIHSKKKVKAPVFYSKKTFNIANIFPYKIQALLEKEIHSLWRNHSYKKLKIQSYLVFLLFSFFLMTANIEHKEIWLALITCTTVWLHYSSNFNEKYIIPDPDWFIRTLPIRFRHLFFAKYFAEIAFVLLLIISDIILIQFSGVGLLIQFYAIALVFLFAHLVLFTMLNFQIMFYDNARLAGYAYHFSLLFIVIMILNYRLVGPIITLGLLIFFLYKNVKYFNN